MFKKLKEAIDAALSALEGKAGEAPAEDIERLLAGMRKELIDNKARIPVLEQTLDQLRRSHERELERPPQLVQSLLEDGYPGLVVDQLLAHSSQEPLDVLGGRLARFPLQGAEGRVDGFFELLEHAMSVTSALPRWNPSGYHQVAWIGRFPGPRTSHAHSGHSSG